MRANIRTRLFFQFTLSVVLIIAISMIILLFNFKDILLSQAVEDQSSFIMNAVSNVEKLIYELDRITLYLCGDKHIPQILGEVPDNEVDANNFPKKLQSSVSIYTLYPITESSIEFYSFLFITEDFPSSKYLNSYQLSNYLKLSAQSSSVVSNSNLSKNEDWYKKTIELNTRIHCFLLDDSKEFVFFSKLVRNINFETSFYDEEIGVLVFAVKKADIVKMLNVAKATEGTEVILTYEDVIITGTAGNDNSIGNEIPGKFTKTGNLKSDKQLHSISYNDTKFNGMRSKLTWGLEIMTMIPERDITKQLDSVLDIMIIQLLVVMLLSLLISAIFSNIFTKPIIYLVEQMQKVKREDQLVEISHIPNRNDEISYLYMSYNNMISRITKLVEDIKVTMTLQKRSELKALQSQINPHFIYNSLDTVNWIALCDGQKEISVIVTSLSDIFRYSIKDSNIMVTLEEEINHLLKYLRIQSMRYTDKFEFNMEIPESLLSYKLPKLTIQPLVENSLLHVINNDTIVEVNLSAENTGTEVKIIVSDSGKSAEPNKINEYLIGKNTLQSSGEGIGIRNLNKRIIMYYGERYGLHYERKDGKLVAILILPPVGLSKNMSSIDTKL